MIDSMPSANKHLRMRIRFKKFNYLINNDTFLAFVGKLDKLKKIYGLAFLISINKSSNLYLYFLSNTIISTGRDRL